MNKTKLTYIDSIKGLCTLYIIILHFLLTFCPYGYVGWFCSKEALDNPVQYYFSNFPFSILTNNSLALYVFMGITAFIPSYFYFKNENEEAPRNTALKRYCRLMPMTFVGCIISIILYNTGLYPFVKFASLTNNDWILAIKNTSNYTLIAALKEGLFTAYIKGTEIVCTLWCIHYFFLGSFFTAMILFVFGKAKHRYIYYIILSIFLYFTPEYLSFLVSIISADIIAHKNAEAKKLSYFLLFIICIIISFFPPVLLPKFIDVTILYAIGTFGIILGCATLFKDSKFLNLSILCSIGKKSLAITITHSFIFLALNCNLYILFNNIGLSKPLNIFINFLLYIPLSLLSATIYDKLLTPITTKLCKICE